MSKFKLFLSLLFQRLFVSQVGCRLNNLNYDIKNQNILDLFIVTKTTDRWLMVHFWSTQSCHFGTFLLVTETPKQNCCNLQVQPQQVTLAKLANGHRGSYLSSTEKSNKLAHTNNVLFCRNINKLRALEQQCCKQYLTKPVSK